MKGEIQSRRTPTAPYPHPGRHLLDDSLGPGLLTPGDSRKKAWFGHFSQCPLGQ